MRTNRWLWVSGIATLLFAGSELAAFLRTGSGHIWAVLPIIISIPIAFWFVRSGRRVTGITIILTAIGLQSILTPFVQRGVGVPNAIISLALIGCISMATLPRVYTGRVLVGALIVSIAAIVIDLFGNLGRPPAQLAAGRWVFAAGMLFLFGIFLTRELFSLDIRTKIVLGIIGTGSLFWRSWCSLLYFSPSRSQIRSLSDSKRASANWERNNSSIQRR
jgi:hypothetical protein